MNQISFSQAVDGYLLYAHSRRLSECTLAGEKRSRLKRGVFDGAEVLVKMDKRWYNLIRTGAKWLRRGRLGLVLQAGALGPREQLSTL